VHPSRGGSRGGFGVGERGCKMGAASSPLCRQLTARSDSVSQNTGSAVQVVAYLGEHSMQELDVATAGEYLVRLEGGRACG
jgi:hypothetical protein